MYRTIRLFILFQVFCLGTLCAQEGYPKPNVPNLLFYIQHNRGHNTYLYQLNVDAHGTVNTEEPIKVTRQLFDKGGEIKPLTDIQRKFAYGVKVRPVSNTEYTFTLVAYPNQELHLKLTGKSKGAVYTTVNGNHMQVQQLFLVQKEGTSGLGTKLDYILFHGKNAQGKKLAEKFTP